MSSRSSARRRRQLLVRAAAFGALLAAGCGDEPTSTAVGSSTLAPASTTSTAEELSTEPTAADPKIVVLTWPEIAEHGGDIDTAGVAGTVVVENGCVAILVELVDGSEAAFPAVWTYKSVWDDALGGLAQPNGDVLRVGDKVDAGGWWSSFGRLAEVLDPEVAAGAETCAAGQVSEVAIFHNGQFVTPVLD